MCGIMGYAGRDGRAAEIVHDGLRRLEYRGYDSAGIATVTEDSDITITKDTGTIDEIHSEHDFHTLSGNVGIGHTRWATHGGVTRDNAHPHVDEAGRVALVHNGIIENYEELKTEMEVDEFYSETDSEVAAHFFGERLEAGEDPEDIMQEFLDIAEGTFAIAVIDKHDDRIYAMKRKSPLALGIGEDAYYVGSDLYAFSTHTDEAIFFDDDEYAVIGPDEVTIYDQQGLEITREAETFDWNQEQKERDEYDHYMLQEIHEEPDVARRVLRSLETDQRADLDVFVEAIEEAEKVIFTAAGTSYHASLMAVYYFQQAGVDAQALIASEFENYERVDEDTLVIAISQSGETMDVLEALEFSREKGGDIASIVNVPHSSIQRESKASLEVRAGQEVAVASTKAFINQMLTVMTVADELGADIELDTVPDRLEQVIEDNERTVAKLAEGLEDADDLYVIGRGTTYPVSREVALKMKEIPYIHAEGMMGGELKHGTLALVEDGTPVMSLIPEEGDEIISNVKEVEARGARSIKVSPYYGDFDLPEDRDQFALYATTIGFLLSYYVAKGKDLPIDKPRNLAKSVTVK